MNRLALPAFALSLAVAALVGCSGSPPPAGGAGNPAPPASEPPTDTTPPPTDTTPPPPAPPAPSPGGDDHDGDDDDGDTLATIPSRFHGEWNSHLPDCGTGNNESRLTVEAGALRFYEATAQVEAVRVDGDALSVDTTLTGEGVSRDRTFN